MPTVPLQTPGGPELLIIALNLAILFALVAGIVYLVRRFSARRARNAERIEELERRVQDLEE